MPYDDIILPAIPDSVYKEINIKKRNRVHEIYLIFVLFRLNESKLIGCMWSSQIIEIKIKKMPSREIFYVLCLQYITGLQFFFFLLY